MSFRSGCSGTFGVLFAIFVVIPVCGTVAFLVFGYFAVQHQHAEMLERRRQEVAPKAARADPVPVPAVFEPPQRRREPDPKEVALARARQREHEDAPAKEKVAEQAAENEKLAAAKLKAAESLLKAGKPDAYRKWLRELIEKYPTTKAAEKARTALK